MFIRDRLYCLLPGIPTAWPSLYICFRFNKVGLNLRSTNHHVWATSFILQLPSLFFLYSPEFFWDKIWQVYNNYDKIYGKILEDTWFFLSFSCQCCFKISFVSSFWRSPCPWRKSRSPRWGDVWSLGGGRPTILVWTTSSIRLSNGFQPFLVDLLQKLADCDKTITTSPGKAEGKLGNPKGNAFMATSCAWMARDHQKEPRFGSLRVFWHTKNEPFS